MKIVDLIEYHVENTNINLKFIAHKMWHLTEPNIKEDEDKLFSFTHWAKAWDNIHKFEICTEPKPL